MGGVKSVSVLVVLVGLLAGASASSPPTGFQDVAGISAEALAQIDALSAEKAARTPAQKKMDSRLVLAAKAARGELRGLPLLQTNLRVSSDGKVELEIRCDVTDALVSRLVAEGVEVIFRSARYRSLGVRADLNQVEVLAAWPDISFIMPMPTFRFGRTPVAPSGPVTSQGDVSHKAANGRAIYGIDGRGVKIGVISDGVTNLAESQRLGELGDVTVLEGQSGSGDEGTAMLEIIHDLAPGATLYFATAGEGPASMVSNIRALQSQGCHIIVDDVGFRAASPFQDGQSGTSFSNGGIVTQAVKDVSALGVFYFSSAGNSGNIAGGAGGTWEGDFQDAGTTAVPVSTSGRMHRFGTQSYNVLSSEQKEFATVSLFWAEPLAAASSDYDFYVLNQDGTQVVAAGDNEQSGTQDPYEVAWVTTPFTGLRLVIVKRTGSARFLHVDVEGRMTIASNGAIRGHAATSAAYSFGVAATPATGPYPQAFSASNRTQPYSSDGPRRIFFDGDGRLLTPNNLSSSGGVLLNKPDFTAADGVSVSGVGGFGRDAAQCGATAGRCFFGTSASAPHAAAIAALIKSKRPSISPAQLRVALFNAVVDIGGGGFDPDSGAGILLADRGVGSVSFIDEPLVAGVTSIKAEHFAEMRSRIEAIRSAADLGSFSWTQPLTPAVSAMRAGDILEMRRALQDAYDAAGLTRPKYSTLPAVGVPIRLADVVQLRAAILEIESSAPADSCVARALIGSEPDGPQQLQEFRLFRDGPLSASSLGRSATDAYYRHSPEIVSLTMARPYLALQMATLARDLRPLMRASATQRGSAGGTGAVVTATLVDQINNVLDQLETIASPDLRSDVLQFRAIISIREAVGRPLGLFLDELRKRTVPGKS